MTQISSTDLLHPAIKMKEEVAIKDFFWIVVSIILFSGDFILNIILVVYYFEDGKIWYFGLTLCCIVIPALILTVFNLWFYKTGEKMEVFKVSSPLRIIRTLLILLLMAPLLKNFEALYYGIKSRKSKEDKQKKLYSLKMKLFMVDAAILTLLEAFMECGPQAVLQLYIFAQSQAYNPNIFTETEILQMTSVFLSLLSMSATYVMYQNSLRFCLENKKKLNIQTMLFLFNWRFFEITSRVITLGLFASVFPYYLLIFCCAHFIAMFIWIWKMKTNLYENKKREFLYNLVLGEVFIFIFLNPKYEQTKRLYAVFYILMVCENSALISVWFYYYSPFVNLKLPALILQFSSFIGAVVLMVTYYYFLHPSRGKCTEKSRTVETPSETLKKNYETNADSDENENINTKEPVT